MFGGKFVIKYYLLSTDKYKCFHGAAVAFIISLTKGSYFQLHNLLSFKNRVYIFFLLPGNYSWLITKMSMTFHNKQKTFLSLVKLVPCHTAWHILGLQMKEMEFRHGG